MKKNIATDLVDKARDRVRPVGLKGLKLADRALTRIQGDVRRRLDEIELEAQAPTPAETAAVDEQQPTAS